MAHVSVKHLFIQIIIKSWLTNPFLSQEKRQMTAHYVTLFLVAETSLSTMKQEQAKGVHLFLCVFHAICNRGRWFTPGEVSAYLHVLLCLLSVSCNWRNESVWCSPGSKLLIYNHFCQTSISEETQLQREERKRLWASSCICLYKTPRLLSHKLITDPE